MKNLMNKIRKSNKGFTLVELIIVIAIIAVLAAVIAPQYIKYVDKSRKTVDENTLDEIAHVMEIAAADEKVYEEIKTSGSSITVKEGTSYGTTELAKAVEAVIPNSTVDFTSKAYDGKSVVISISNVGVASYTKLS